MDQTNLKNSVICPTRERIVAIDILRSFALFGVLTANALGFSYSCQFYAPLGYPELDEVRHAYRVARPTFCSALDVTSQTMVQDATYASGSPIWVQLVSVADAG